MNTIADSGAIRDPTRVFPQHQAAITLLQANLADPSVHEFLWLDLACGRGQIIADLKENLSAEARAKLIYQGYDVRQEYARETVKTAATLGLKGHDVTIGQLANMSRLYEPTKRFDFITLTNTVHEVAPHQLGAILFECVYRLSDKGTLFIYDMESVDPPELGAVPWSKSDIAGIVSTLCQSLGIQKYLPEVGQWRHRTCDAWNVQIQRIHFSLEASALSALKEKAVGETSAKIRELLQSKLINCKAALESLTRYGSETSGERAEKDRLLYSFWALNRSLEAAQ